MSYIETPDRIVAGGAITTIPVGQIDSGPRLLPDAPELTGAVMPFERNAEILIKTFCFRQI